uniref:Uncharacterized protein n=1 Tax=Oryza rufipogon TaxID=4529 RepID=A0A0E0P548_ORYRU
MGHTFIELGKHRSSVPNNNPNRPHLLPRRRRRFLAVPVSLQRRGARHRGLGRGRCLARGWQRRPRAASGGGERWRKEPVLFRATYLLQSWAQLLKCDEEIKAKYITTHGVDITTSVKGKPGYSTMDMVSETQHVIHARASRGLPS